MKDFQAMVDIFVVEKQDTCVCAEWTAEVRIRKRGQASEDGGPVDYIAIPFFLFLSSPLSSYCTPHQDHLLSVRLSRMTMTDDDVSCFKGPKDTFRSIVSS